MSRMLYERVVFSKASPLPECDAEFDHCRFEGCDYARFPFDGAEFAHCDFFHCDLSMSVLDEVAMHEVRFSGCKLVGVDFGKCSKFQFSVAFTDSLLDYAFFHRNSLKKIKFTRCQLRETNFNECDLSAAAFEDCDLERSHFEQCNLEGADFRSARNYSIHPSMNKIKKAHFALPGVLGLLDHLDIRIEDPG